MTQKFPAREVGAATKACPHCSTQRVLHTNRDGSVSAERCGTCYPEQPREVQPETAEIDEPVLAREHGTEIDDDHQEA